MGRIYEDENAVILRTLETVINTLDTMTLTFTVVMERQIKLEDRVWRLKKKLDDAKFSEAELTVIPTEESEEKINVSTTQTLLLMAFLFMMVYMLHESTIV